MIKWSKLTHWVSNVFIIQIFLFLSLFRISCFEFRIFYRKSRVFGQALYSYSSRYALVLLQNEGSHRAYINTRGTIFTHRRQRISWSIKTHCGVKSSVGKSQNRLVVMIPAHVQTFSAQYASVGIIIYERVIDINVLVFKVSVQGLLFEPHL